MRLSKDRYFMKIAELVAQRSTCPRRDVGCVIVDNNSYIKATGYNGVPRGYTHCNEENCGADNIDQCLAIHAEQNALLQCENINSVAEIYTTTSPCLTCAKMIANTSVKRVIYKEQYKCTKGLDLLRSLGVICETIKD